MYPSIKRATSILSLNIIIYVFVYVRVRTRFWDRILIKIFDRIARRPYRIIVTDLTTKELLM